MASLLYQTIEQISREKHIERRSSFPRSKMPWWLPRADDYKTEEDLRAKFNPESGQVDVFAVRRWSRK